MKKNILKLILSLLLILGTTVACDSDLNMDGADTSSLRVSLTPAPEIISANGTTFTAAVVVNQGQNFDVDWTVSVDHNLSWISVETTKIDKTFTGTYSGDDATYTVSGIKVTVQPNETGINRMANIRFTVSDNSSVIYTIYQDK